MKTGEIIIIIIVIIIGVITMITVFNYPKQYDCYLKQCVEYNTDSCEYLGYESTGFLSGEEFYNCNGIKVAKDCFKFEDIKQDIKPNLWDIFSYKCSRIEDRK